MWEAISGLGGAILGAVVGGYISFWLTESKNRTQLLFDLHALFNGPEFSQIRLRAAETLVKYADLTFDSIPQTGRDDFAEVWTVVRFYQRLWIAVKFKQVRLELVPELFGDVFYWWYILHYADRLVHLPYQSAQQIKDLKEWFDHNAPKPLLKTWIERREAEKELVEKNRVTKLEGRTDSFVSIEPGV